MKQTMFARLRRWLYRRPLAAMACFGGLYLVLFRLLERAPRPVHLIQCGLDARLPFVSGAVLPYVGWFLWVPGVLVYLLVIDRNRFWRGFSAMAGGIVLTLCLYAVWPTGLALRGSVPGEGFCSQLVRLIYRMDTPTNVCPSLHVFVTALLLCALWGRLGWLGRVCNGLAGAAICLSTVLLDQHSVIDVGMGLLLALAMWQLSRAGRFARREKPGRENRSAFSTAGPNHVENKPG